MAVQPGETAEAKLSGRQMKTFQQQMQRTRQAAERLRANGDTAGVARLEARMGRMQQKLRQVSSGQGGTGGTLTDQFGGKYGALVSKGKAKKLNKISASNKYKSEESRERAKMKVGAVNRGIAPTKGAGYRQLAPGAQITRLAGGLTGKPKSVLTKAARQEAQAKGRKTKAKVAANKKRKETIASNKAAGEANIAAAGAALTNAKPKRNRKKK